MIFMLRLCFSFFFFLFFSFFFSFSLFFRSVLYANPEGGLSIVSVGDETDPSAMDGAKNNRALALSPCFLTNRVAVCNADHSVQLFSVSPDGTQVEYCADVAKFTDHALCVSLSTCGKFLICGSENGWVKMYNIENDEVHLLHEMQLEAAILSVTLDASNEVLAVACSDGKVRFYDFASKKMIKLRQELQNLKNAIFVDGFTAMLGMAWHPSKKQLAVPCEKGVVKIFDAADPSFKVLKELKKEGGAASNVSFSKNGLYLVVTRDDTIEVWDLKQKRVVSSAKLGGDVLRVCWNPYANILVAVTGSGEMKIWEEAVPEDLTEPHAMVEEEDEEGKENGEMMSMFQDDDDLLAAAMLEHETSQKKKAQEEGGNSQRKNDGAADTVTPMRLKKKNSSGDDLNGTVVDFDVQIPLDYEEDEEVAGAGTSAMDAFESPYSAIKPSYGAGASISSEAINDNISLKIEELVSRFSFFDAPLPFNPSATTSVSTVGNRRVLIWNRVGRAICIDDRMESIVEVEFADRTAHRKIRVADLYSYNMGGLSEAGVALAASAMPDQGTRAVIHFKPVSGLVGGAEWQELLENGDDVLGVALGHNWVAAVCAPYMYLRVWSTSGLQAIPMQLPISKFVAMVGQGTRLAIFHATAVGLQVLVYDMELRRQVFSQAAPLTPKAELTWCGFTPTGVVVTVDSAGVGRMLVNSGDWAGQWVPLIQAEGPIDLSRRWPLGWPIGATDDSLVVVRLNETEEIETGLVLDDDNRGAPSIDTMRWNTPLAAPNSALSIGLESVLRRRLMLGQSAEPNPRRELEIDSEIVKLVVLAAKNQLPQKALELFCSLRSNQTKLVAMKWVGSNGYDALFTKMEAEWRSAARETLGLRDENEEEEEEEEEVEEEEEESANEPKSKRSSPTASKRKASSNDLFDDEQDVSSQIASKLAKQKSTGGKKNPFSSKTSMRRASSGGVLEALARIEGKK
jgi:WD40 repeat protein